MDARVHAHSQRSNRPDESLMKPKKLFRQKAIRPESMIKNAVFQTILQMCGRKSEASECGRSQPELRSAPLNQP